MLNNKLKNDLSEFQRITSQMNEKIKESLNHQQIYYIFKNNKNHLNELMKLIINQTKEKPKVKTNDNLEILNAIADLKTNFNNRIDLLETDVAELKTDVAELKIKVDRIETDVALIKSLPTIQKEINELNKSK